jgi:hypothetical protein
MRPTVAVANRQASSQQPSPSPQRGIAADVIDSARAVFRAWIAGTADDADFRCALRRFCDAAQCQQLRPEQVLVALKSMLRAVPEIRSTRKRDSCDDLIARAVTMCIEEYYAVPADRRRSG